MKTLLLILSVLVSLCQGQETESSVSEAELASCPCITLYRPVCGENGESFSNSCVADCNKVDVQCQGECPCKEDTTNVDFPSPPEEQQPCPALLRPVCTVDGNTYDNECQAQKSGEEILCDGECPCTDDCPFCCTNSSPECKLVRVACNGCTNNS